MQNLLALPTGTELAEDYRIVRVLGAGGFGLTYLAREETLDRSVTIKEYFPSDFAAREATLSVRPRSIDAEADYGWGLERFIEEAQTLARFDHPHINRVYRYFRANNTAYMVLHFEEGQSFKSWLAGLGRAPRQAELDDIIGPLLDALEMIHAGNFLHRDIAPDNIIIRKTGGPVLIDFGSARGEMVQLSKTVSALVKPGYSPYEQYGLSGRQQGPWTDIYSLGATLYQAIAGKRPTDAPSRMVGDDYKPAASVALSSYRPRFLSAIDHALKLRVEQRPQTVAAWRRELALPNTVAATKATGTFVPPAPAEPALPPAVTPKIFQRKAAPAVAAGSKAATPAGAMAQAPDAASGGASGVAPKISFKHRLVRLLEGVAACPESDRRIAPPAPLQMPTPDAKVAPKAAAKPSAIPRNPQPPPVIAKATATPPAVIVAPRSATPPPVPAAPARDSGTGQRRQGSRGTAVKLLAGAVLSALLLSYQHQIAAGWRTVSHFLAPPSPVTDRRPAETASDGRQAANISPVTAAATSTDAKAVPRRVDEIILKGHRGAVHALGFVADGTALASTGADGTLRLWHAGKGELIRTLEAGDNLSGALAVRDSTAAVGHQDGTVTLWDLDRGQRLRAIKRNDALIWAVAFAGTTERVLAAAQDGTTTLWTLSQDAGPPHLLEGHDGAAQAVAHGPRIGTTGIGTLGLVATGGADKTVKLWSAVDHALIRTYRGHRDAVSALAIAPDGAMLASASIDKTVKLWSTSDSGSLRTLRGHKGPVTSVAFGHDGLVLATGSADGTVRLWDWKRGRVLRTLAGHSGGVRAVAFSSDGKFVATGGDDGTVRLWPATLPARATASRT